MQRSASIQRAQRFLVLLERSRVLLFPNAWVAGSVRVLARLGFDAIAPTSGGVAWSLGYAGGQEAPVDEIIAAAGRSDQGASLPDLAQLSRLGVARVSTATALITAALPAAPEMPSKPQSGGGFDGFGATLGYQRIQRLFVNSNDTAGGT